MKNQVNFALIMAVVLSGCAGSAAHKVVTANQSSDNSIDCKTVEAEIVRTQVIIDDVNKDKDDISGADIVDGVLWFPFNLIAKQQNYNNALEAADKRLARLNEIKSEKNCLSADADLKGRTNTALTELEKLAKLHRDGVLSDEEYVTAKQKILERI